MINNLSCVIFAFVKTKAVTAQLISAFVFTTWIAQLVCVRASFGACENSQVLLAGVPGGFSWGSPVLAPPTDWPSSYELK